MKKISYILPTNRTLTASNAALNSIFNLAPHDKEIIITGPEGCIDASLELLVKQHNIKFILEGKMHGACQPINDAAKVTDGDYITVMSDDIAYTPTFLDLLEWMEGDFVKQKDFKVANIMFDAGPKLYTYGHDDLEDGKSFWWPVAPHELLPDEAYPFSLIPMPFIERKTYEDRLDGQIYHPAFNHHYGDSWFGFYLSKMERFEPHKWRCPTVSYVPDRVNGRCNTNHDMHDVGVFKSLVSKFLGGHRSYAE